MAVSSSQIHPQVYSEEVIGTRNVLKREQQFSKTEIQNT